MATSLFKLASIFALLVILLLPSISPNPVSDDSEEQDYILDNPFPSTYLRHKLLAKIKKGTHCDPITKNVCNGISANNGTSLLYCCKTHCRNVLSDRNNCGKCGQKCGIGQLCCGGACTNIAYSTSHCGKCFKACPQGEKCEYGFCGYA